MTSSQPAEQAQTVDPVPAFRDAWVFAALAAELPAPDRWLVHETPGRSMVVARDEQGGLRALRNACSHRGTRLCRGPGGGRLRCPYHGWVFGSDGRLLGASRRAGLPPFDPADLALARAGLDSVGAFLFVHDRPAPATSLRAGLGAAAEALAALPLEGDAIDVRRRRSAASWGDEVVTRLTELPTGEALPGGHSRGEDGDLFVFPNLFVRASAAGALVTSVTPAPGGGAVVIERTVGRGPWRWGARRSRGTPPGGAARAEHFRRALDDRGRGP